VFAQVVELAYFLLLLLVFVFAFGVSTQGIMFESEPISAELLRKVFSPAFWLIIRRYYTRDLIFAGKLKIKIFILVSFKC
jgi:hypothetical protein